MEDKDIFKSEEAEIERLSNILKNMKYVRLCFVDLIDQGAKFTRDNDSVKIEITTDKPTDYKLLAEYYSKLSIIYDNIIESIDKVNLEFKPVSESVITEDNKISVNIKVFQKKTTRVMPDTNWRDDELRRGYYMDRDYNRKSYSDYDYKDKMIRLLGKY